MNYEPDPEMFDEESLFKRIMQLRQLIELDRSKLLANIHESKEKQKAIQEKANKPTKTYIKIVTKVRTKNEGNLSKLDPFIQRPIHGKEHHRRGKLQISCLYYLSFKLTGGYC